MSMVGKRDVVRTAVEYGVLALASRTVLTVTEDYAEAEHTLDLIGEGRLVRRTVTYGSWIDIPAPQPSRRA
jgi:hypothetical protein